MNWKLIKSEEKYRNRYMTVTEDVVITNHGDQVTFGVVHKKPGVSIIPWDGAKFTLVKQYRYPVDFDSWEFPAGHFEHRNFPSAARAELQEEAGLLAGELSKIGEFHLGPGHSDQIIYFYLATNLVPVAQKLETAEKGLVVGHFTHQEINQMIQSSQIKDSLTIAALKFFELHASK